MGIFGPSLGPELSSGFELLRNIMNGTMKAIPNLVLGIVDVRDVADLHLKAMTSAQANGERFLALAGGTMSLLQMARLREAYFLIDKEGHRPSDVYLEVGFEDLSHFSFAFKKLFGFPPTRLPQK